MRSYFINLFGYDRYANKLINNCLTACDSAEVVKLMAHLLAAQQIWLNRCNGVSNPNIVLWPDWNADIFEKTIEDNHTAWMNFLDKAEPGDFEKIIFYKNSKGDDFESKLTDILTHIINHGTHHRSQAGQHLKLAGLEQLPVTDYIFYLRNKG